MRFPNENDIIKARLPMGTAHYNLEGCGLPLLVGHLNVRITQIGMSLSGVTNGALLTLFIMGIFIPRANAKGAIAGSVSSLVVMAWIIGKAQYYFATGMLKYPGKHTSVDSCPQNYTSDPEVLSHLETYRGYSTPVVADTSVSLLYQVSYMYYTLFGTLLGLTVGMTVSLLTEPPKLSALDRQLFTTYVHHLLPRSPSKSHSVTFAEEEFKLIKYNTVPNEEVTTNAQAPIKKENTEVLPPKEDISKPE